MLRDDIQWASRPSPPRTEVRGARCRYIDNFLTIFKRYPDMKVVIDHCMKPQIAEHSKAGFASWADGMARLADRSSAFCKFSALITEAASDWSVEDLRPYVGHVIGIQRRRWWGSNGGLQAGRRIYGMARRRAGTDGRSQRFRQGRHLWADRQPVLRPRAVITGLVSP